MVEREDITNVMGSISTGREMKMASHISRNYNGFIDVPN